MKKLANILFLSVYLSLSLGMTLSIHFCGETITSVQIVPFDFKDDLCGCAESDEPDDCCKNEIKSIQLKDEQIFVHAVQLSSPQTAENIWAVTSASELYSTNFIRLSISSHSPPEESPLYILHRSLLI